MSQGLANGSGLAVVTGGGSGIGRGCVEMFARRCLQVVVVGRTQAALDDTVGSVAGAGGRAVAVVADCATSGGRGGGVAAVAGLGVPVVALVHAAGADLVATFGETTEAQFDSLMDINVRAPFFLTQQLVPMLANGAGVVFVGSISATRARPRHAAY